METRAHHVLIGASTLGALFVLTLFAIWLGSNDYSRSTRDYDIVFVGGVTGLDVGSDVLYSGIKVGQVTNVQLDRANPDNVRIRVRIDDATPVSTDSVAKLETGVLTGLSVVRISGGSEFGRELKPAPGNDVPLIRSERTPLQQLVAGAPELIKQGNLLLERFNAIASQENADAIGEIVGNIRDLTGTLGESSGQIERILSNADRIAAELAEASDRIDEITANIEKVTQSADQTVASLAGLSREAELAVRETRPALEEFSRGGLPQVVLLVQDARALMMSLERLVARLESDPGAFLLGRGAPEYVPGAARRE
ncbi:MAG: MCE family protein [Alphaproteobacteria bacterium]|nr:MCE family protein [Alphaproteobacteria bacterium]